jgi:serine/threonine protein kinase
MEFSKPCPDPEQIQAYRLGHLTPADARAVAQHVDECHRCRQLVERPPLAQEATQPNRRPAPAVHAVTQPPLAHSVHASAPTLNTPLPGAGAPRVVPQELIDFPYLLPPVEPDEIGRLGSYRVLRLLGQGGMGLVFHAEDIALRRPVALKVMRPELCSEQEMWQRFVREARSLAAIKSPHLVTIYQAGQEGLVHYFAMEMLAGESLDARIHSGQPFGSATLIRLTREIALGLAAMHQHGLVHRDLKPANVWLEAPEERIKILDFGLVRAATDVRLTQTGVVMGTPSYMSPEQARGEQVDHRSDLFSLGGIVYTMATGRKPFPGETTLAVLTSLASDHPVPIHERNPALPRALSDLVVQLLEKDPKHRPESAQTVVDKLDKIAAGRAEVAKPVVRAPGPMAVAKRPAAVPRPRPVRPAVQRPVEPADDDETPKMQRSRRRTPSTWWPNALLVIMPPLLAILSFFGVYIAMKPRGTAAANAVSTSTASSTPVAPATPVVLGAGPRTYVTQLETVDRVNWPADLPKAPPPDAAINGLPPDAGRQVIVNGVVFPQGISMHPPHPNGGAASVSHRLGRQYSTFQCQVSLNDGPSQSHTPLTFTVYGDGKVLWRSNPVQTRSDGQSCSVSVAGVDVLKLEVNCPGESHGAFAVWLDPSVAK